MTNNGILYDVPYIVREANDKHMSAKRYRRRRYYQAVVDDYFIARANGLSGQDAREYSARRHHTHPDRVKIILIWFYIEAEKQRKYDFLEKFSLSEEQIH